MCIRDRATPSLTVDNSGLLVAPTITTDLQWISLQTLANNIASVVGTQQPADWDAVTGVTRILNKPDIPNIQGFAGNTGVALTWNQTTGVITVNGSAINSMLTSLAARVTALES